MSVTYTENYNLGKQENHSDKFDMTVITENMDKIDTAMAEQKAEIAATSEALASETVYRQEEDSRLSEETALNRSTLGYQRKNLLKITAVSKTVNGVIFTVNNDGSVTANGTATKTAIFTLSKINLTVGKKYTLSGCPTGGSSDTFKLFGVDTEETGIDGADYGIGDTFTSKFSNVQYHIVIYAGHTASNLTFYPMLRYAEITDDTYEPYKPSIEERLATLEATLMAAESGA